MKKEKIRKKKAWWGLRDEEDGEDETLMGETCHWASSPALHSSQEHEEQNDLQLNEELLQEEPNEEEYNGGEGRRVEKWEIKRR